MTITQLLSLLRRWLWLVVVCPALAAAVAYGFSLTQPKLYEAKASMLVRPAQPLSVSDPSVAGLTSDQVVATYAVLIVQRPMLEEVIGELGLKATPEQLSSEISARPEVGTTILDVTVTDRDSKTASDIANRLVGDFVASVKRLQEAESTAPNARSADNLVVIAPAIADPTPVSPKPTRNALLAAIAGLIIALGLVALLELLDNTVKDDERLIDATGLIPIGHVPFERAKSGRRAELFALTGEPIAEAYKVLRTNLLFTSVDRKVQVILVTSTLPGEGKSRTAANLAIALAQAGHSVVLVDADFRRPAQHRLFGRVRNVGLSNLILQDGQPLADSRVPQVPNLTLLTTGPTPPNPSELLGSGRMNAILADLRRDFTYVIIDTPPVLAVTDAVILAAAADGCMLVVEQAKTPIPGIRRSIEALRRVDATILGAVLNKIQSGRDAVYYNYEYGTSKPEAGPAAVRSAASAQREASIR